MDLRIKYKILTEEILVAKSELKGFNYHLGKVLANDLMSLVFGLDTEVIIKDENFDMFDILVEIGAFKSRSDAKKNWKFSDQNIETGCHSFLIGKKKLPVFIFKPIQETEWNKN